MLFQITMFLLLTSRTIAVEDGFRLLRMSLIKEHKLLRVPV